MNMIDRIIDVATRRRISFQDARRVVEGLEASSAIPAAPEKTRIRVVAPSREVPTSPPERSPVAMAEMQLAPAPCAPADRTLTDGERHRLKAGASASTKGRLGTVLRLALPEARVSLLGSVSMGCLWIDADKPSSFDYRCGAKLARPGCSWCEVHAARIMVPAGQRKASPRKSA